MTEAASARRSVWLLAGLLLVLAGVGAMTYGALEADAPQEPEVPAAGPPRADNHLGFLLGGAMASVLGLVVVYRVTG